MQLLLAAWIFLLSLSLEESKQKIAIAHFMFVFNCIRKPHVYQFNLKIHSSDNCIW
jgi:hypothetical protein